MPSTPVRPPLTVAESGANPTSSAKRKRVGTLTLSAKRSRRSLQDAVAESELPMSPPRLLNDRVPTTPDISRCCIADTPRQPDGEDDVPSPQTPRVKAAPTPAATTLRRSGRTPAYRKLSSLQATLEPPRTRSKAKLTPIALHSRFADESTSARTSTCSSVSASDSSSSEDSSLPSSPSKPLRSQPADLFSLFSLDTTPDVLLCRDKECTTIRSFLLASLQERKGASMYVCGSPGTGKTLCVSSVLSRLSMSDTNTSDQLQIRTPARRTAYRKASQRLPKFKSVMLNGMALKDPKKVYSHILHSLRGKQDQPLVKTEDAIAALNSLFLPSSTTNSASSSSSLVSSLVQYEMFVVVIDEIDALLRQSSTASQQLLYHLFEWPARPSSRLVLVGIANTINLTRTCLPRLTASHLVPEEVVFEPYSACDIAQILKQRVQMACLASDAQEVDDKSLDFLARKIAKGSGDVRKALELCRSALANAKTQQALAAKAKETEQSCSESETGSFAIRTPAKTPVRVGFQHVQRAVQASFSGPYQQIICSLPSKQRMVLCMAVLIFNDTKRELLTSRFIDFVQQTATSLGYQDAVEADSLPFIVSALCVQGLMVTFGPGQETRRLRGLSLTQNDIRHALTQLPQEQGKPLFEILDFAVSEKEREAFFVVPMGKKTPSRGRCRRL